MEGTGRGSEMVGEEEEKGNIHKFGRCGMVGRETNERPLSGKVGVEEEHRLLVKVWIFVACAAIPYIQRGSESAHAGVYGSSNSAFLSLWKHPTTFFSF